MKSPPNPHPAHARSQLAIIAAALLSTLTIGCASPGVPRPPSLHLPQVVGDLTAERIGDDVYLHWTTPSRTTDDLDLKGTLAAEICRETTSTPASSPPNSSANCVAIKRLTVRSGPTQDTDPLTGQLAADTPSLLAYRIQIFNANGHSAGLSPRAFAAAGSAPPPVERLRATATRKGAQLEWQPQATPVPVELDRLLIAQPAPQPAPQPAQLNPAPKAATKPAVKQPLNLAPAPPTEVHLQADNQPADSGGTLDSSALKGQTYRYTAQRVRKVLLSGHTLQLHSIPSPPITIAMHDTFSPARPNGLAAIPGGTGQSPDRSIDLSWEPVVDSDLAGYLVYRQNVTVTGTLSGTATRLTPTPVTGPAFSDHTAVLGQTYAYSVTAIDTTGNESPPSADVQEILREQ